jgi:hypothetical protein
MYTIFGGEQKNASLAFHHTKDVLDDFSQYSIVKIIAGVDLSGKCTVPFLSQQETKEGQQ